MPVPLIWMAGSALVSFAGGFFTGSNFTSFIKWLSVLASVLAAAYYFFIHKAKG